MTEVKAVAHTEGPWVVDEYALFVNARGAEHMRICDIRGWGHLTGMGGGRGLSEEAAMAIQRANANLIAAAPDLLALLVELKASHYWAAVREEYENRVEAAIAKAEGTTP